jgi:hypothetical protein
MNSKYFKKLLNVAIGFAIWIGPALYVNHFAPMLFTWILAILVVAHLEEESI